MLLELNMKQKAATHFGTCITGLLIAFLLRHDPLICTAFLGIVVFLLTGKRPTTVYAVAVTLKRDVMAGTKYLIFNLIMMYYEWRKMTVPKVFRNVLRKNAEKTAFIMDDKKLTFQDVEDFSNKIGSYFKSKGFVRGDTIALFMDSRPEYSVIWLGLSKVGIVTALINSNLRKETLLHSIRVANSKAIIVGTELASAIAEIRNEDGVRDTPLYEFSDGPLKDGTAIIPLQGATDLCSELQSHKAIDLEEEIDKANPKDKLVYIYTSGTTGLPKAAVITHLRYMFMGVGSYIMIAIQKDDIIYNPLPLYHTAGGMLGVGNVFLNGVTMAIRKKFSASNFWTDCIKYNCTIAQYIGELCRYILTVPPKPTDTQHSIRLMFGNGLRPQIWLRFISRFDIPQIAEFYGSTEGNSNLVNCENQIGAIGFMPLLAGSIYPVKLIKCDEETGEPIRDSNGRCINCNPGEPGIFIGKINQKRAHTAFNGYADKTATEKKVVHDVFQEGDLYFNSGDILVRDILGYFYFKDRTGDTFRWRGENVATSEVEAVISNVVGLQDCVVYGVEIPHVEGKAGMAAIVDAEKIVDMEQLSVGIRGSLPPFARPLFIRLLPKLPMTGTFKLKKRDLQMEGFDIGKIKDPIFFLNSDGIYRIFTQKDFDDIKNGTARL